MHRVQVLARQLTADAGRQEGDAGGSLLNSQEEYDRLYKWSLDDPNSFWTEAAKVYHWQTPFHQQHTSYNFNPDKGPVYTEFFKGGCTNLAYNCLDRWVAAGRGAQPCMVYEGNEPGQQRTLTYLQVQQEVCRLANWLRAQGVKCGDSVTLYLPMAPELPMAMLACARIGAVHSVVFAGFSADALAQRVMDCDCHVAITSSGTTRGAKRVDLKALVDQAADICASQGHKLRRVLVWEDEAVPRQKCTSVAGRDMWWADEVPRQPDTCDPEWLDAEARCFLLYTSGSTGKPKGVVHTTGGYMVAAGHSARHIFDMRAGDVFWCTADCGWVTGHTYLTYGPLLNGATVVVFGSIPTYPDASRCWKIIQQHKVTQFYTAPTLLRSLMALGDQYVKKCDRSSLRLLGTVGEPINDAAWHWYHNVVGEKRCPIVDTWWQTETGSCLLTPLPGRWCKRKPGSAGIPYFGVQPVILDPQTGKELHGEAEGVLCMKSAWPSIARTLNRDHARYESVYYAPYKGYYFTGDGCRRDADGCYWITGRVDDVINVSGHRIGTAEVEGALTEHTDCAEAAVIGVDHKVKGQAIYAYVTLREGCTADDSVRKRLLDHVRQAIGPFAVPDVVHWAPALPKTRSGKIMRRVLRKVATHEEKELGDVSTLADPGVVDVLIQTRGK